jgi:hypothetical protein
MTIPYRVHDSDNSQHNNNNKYTCISYLYLSDNLHVLPPKSFPCIFNFQIKQTLKT